MKAKKYANGGMMAQGALSGAATGASIGTLFPVPGVGTAVGAIAGGLIGAIPGLLHKDPPQPMKTTPIMNSSNSHVFANGGVMDNYSEVTTGGTHEQNPNGGVPVTNNALLEEGEVKYGKLVFSKRIINPTTGKPFADDAKKYVDKTRPNDPIANRYADKMLNTLFAAQEQLKGPQESQQVMAGGGIISPLMYAPLATEALNLGIGLMNKPETKDLDMFKNNSEVSYNPVDFSQVKRDISSTFGGYKEALPNATRGNAGSYLANLQGLASGQNKAVAGASLQADQYNTQNKMNSEQANAQIEAQNQGNRMQVANMNDADRAAFTNSIMNTVGNLGTQVGNVGRQVTNANIANKLTSYGINGMYKFAQDFENAKKLNPALTQEEFANTYNWSSLQTTPPVNSTQRNAPVLSMDNQTINPSTNPNVQPIIPNSVPQAPVIGQSITTPRVGITPLPQENQRTQSNIEEQPREQYMAPPVNANPNVLPKTEVGEVPRVNKNEQKRLNSLEKQALRSEKENARIAEKEAELKQREELAVSKEEKAKIREERRALRKNKEVAAPIKTINEDVVLGTNGYGSIEEFTVLDEKYKNIEITENSDPDKLTRESESFRKLNTDVANLPQYLQRGVRAVITQRGDAITEMVNNVSNGVEIDNPNYIEQTLQEIKSINLELYNKISKDMLEYAAFDKYVRFKWENLGNEYKTGNKN
jgi:hypothetical protein